MFMALVALAAGLWAGLLRLGYAVPPLPGGVVLAHGPLMAGGFLGTVISLERAVALGQNQGGRRRYYAAPLLSGLAGLLLLTAVPAFIPRLLFVLASLGLVGIFVVIYRMQPGADHAVMGLAAGMWLAGNVLWLAGRPLALVVVWWAGFLVLTIAGERLELARVLLLAPRARRTFSAVVGLFTAGLVVSLVWPDAVHPGETCRVTGPTLPGTPAVVVGSNGHVAWGFTNSEGDWTDVVILDVDPADPQKYLTPEGPRSFDLAAETIHVKGSPDEVLEVRETIWGPVVVAIVHAMR